MYYRQRRTNEAAQYAQKHLAPLRGRLQHLSPEYDEMLHDVVALIAYESPEVCFNQCPGVFMSHEVQPHARLQGTWIDDGVFRMCLVSGLLIVLLCLILCRMFWRLLRIRRCSISSKWAKAACASAHERRFSHIKEGLNSPMPRASDEWLTYLFHIDWIPLCAMLPFSEA